MKLLFVYSVPAHVSDVALAIVHVECQEAGTGGFTFLCVRPGLPVRLRHTVSCITPPLCVYVCVCVRYSCESAGKRILSSHPVSLIRI